MLNRCEQMTKYKSFSYLIDLLFPPFLQKNKMQIPTGTGSESSANNQTVLHLSASKDIVFISSKAPSCVNSGYFANLGAVCLRCDMGKHCFLYNL
jgi:hypothetical protein